MTTVGWETFRTARDEIANCARSQWLESGADHADVPLDQDWEQYQACEALGLFRLLGARRGAELVGYAGYFLTPHMMYRTTPHVMCDSIYVKPSHRGVGVLMIRTAEKLFRAMITGTFRIIYMAQDLTDFPKVLRSLGYPVRETVHVKLMRAT